MSEPTFEKLMEDAVRGGIRDGVKSKLSQSYGPFVQKLDAIVSKNVEGVLEDTITAVMAEREFIAELKVGIREVLGKSLVRKFGGDIERQINDLKSDPRTRERIVNALDQIVQQKDPSPVQPVQGADGVQSSKHGPM